MKTTIDYNGEGQWSRTAILARYTNCSTTARPFSTSCVTASSRRVGQSVICRLSSVLPDATVRLNRCRADVLAVLYNASVCSCCGRCGFVCGASSVGRYNRLAGFDHLVRDLSAALVLRAWQAICPLTTRCSGPAPALGSPGPCGQSVHRPAPATERCCVMPLRHAYCREEKRLVGRTEKAGELAACK